MGDDTWEPLEHVEETVQYEEVANPAYTATSPRPCRLLHNPSALAPGTASWSRVAPTVRSDVGSAARHASPLTPLPGAPIAPVSGSRAKSSPRRRRSPEASRRLARRPLLARRRSASPLSRNRAPRARRGRHYRRPSCRRSRRRRGTRPCQRDPSQHTFFSPTSTGLPSKRPTRVSHWARLAGS